MRNIRWKKDINVTWAITTNGRPESLEGRDISVELTDSLGNTRNVEISTSYDIIHFTFYGTEQERLGTYMVTAWENKGKEGQNVVDKREAFRLVRYSNEEQGNDESNLKIETIDLGTSDFTTSGYHESRPDLHMEVLTLDGSENDSGMATNLNNEKEEEGTCFSFKLSNNINIYKKGDVLSGLGIVVDDGFVLYRKRKVKREKQRRKNPLYYNREARKNCYTEYGRHSKHPSWNVMSFSDPHIISKYNYRLIPLYYLLESICLRNQDSTRSLFDVELKGRIIWKRTDSNKRKDFYSYDSAIRRKLVVMKDGEEKAYYGEPTYGLLTLSDGDSRHDSANTYLRFSPNIKRQAINMPAIMRKQKNIATANEDAINSAPSMQI